MSRVTGLTDLKVKVLKPAANDYFEWDVMTTGLGVKVTPKGRKIWVMQLRWPGSRLQTKRTIGHYPGMGLAEAREIAKRWYGLAKQGKDPAVEAEKARDAAEHERREAERAALNTFASVAEAYIAARTNRHADKDAAAIRRHLVKAWADRPIASITPRDVKQLIGDLARQTPYEARNIWGHAVLVFKYAVHEELIDASPCASLDKKLVIAAKLAPRQRVLSDAELAALWQAALARDYPEGHTVRWLMLTGCRLGEALGARWREFDLDRNVWTVPAERFKSGEENVVPLTDAMLALLGSIPRRGKGALVFSHDGEHLIGSMSKLKFWLDQHMLATLRQRDDDASLPRWVLHDLRRTIRTNLSAMNVPDTVAEAVIGHGRKGIQRVYDRWKYLPQIKVALEAWQTRLASLVGS